MLFEKKILVTAFTAVKLFATDPKAHLDDLEKVKVQYMNKAINRADDPETHLDVRDKEGTKSKNDLISYFQAGKLTEDHEVWQNSNQFAKSEHLLSTIGKKNEIYTIIVQTNANVPDVTINSPKNDKSKPKNTPHKLTFGAQNSISNFVSKTLQANPSAHTDMSMEDRIMDRMALMMNKSTEMLGSVLNEKLNDFWSEDKENRIVEKLALSSQLNTMIEEKTQ